MTKQRIQTRDKIEQLTFLLLLACVTVLFLFLLRPFFAPIFWACAIALLFHPLHARLGQRWNKQPNLVALGTLLFCVVVLVIPVLLILSSFVAEGTDLYLRIESGEINADEYLRRMRETMPMVERTLAWLQLDMAALEEQATAAALAASGFAARNIFSLGQSTFNLILSLALMLYLTFFLLRDGASLTGMLARALPIGDERERLLFAKFVEVTRATIKGNLVVAIVQGALGGLIFWILGISTPVLWGVAMAIVSLIPAVGAGLIWLPVAIYLFVTGATTSSLVLVAYGVGVIGLADNLLRPMLVGRDTKLPDWLVLLSTLGGLAMFGINGFVMGPLVAALFIVFWQIFCRDYNHHEPVSGSEVPPEAGESARNQ